MAAKRPFILIAALRRTGSTVLSEALTQSPHCYIFVEPRLHCNRFSVHPGHYSYFADHGVSLKGYKRLFKLARHIGFDTMKLFHKMLEPRLLNVVDQVGVKEVDLHAWRHYLQTFDDVRVVLTARDPRDIYISIRHFQARGGLQGIGLDFETLVKDFANEFGFQKALADETETVKVRYEDFCTDPSVLTSVKQFVRSPEVGQSSIGAFNAASAWRRQEVDLHGHQLTTRRIGRWRSEPDDQLVAEAQRFMERLPQLCEFWGYPRPEHSTAGGQAG